MLFKIVKVKFTFTNKSTGKENYGYNYYLLNEDETLKVSICPRIVKKNDKVVFSSEDLLRALSTTIKDDEVK